MAITDASGPAVQGTTVELPPEYLTKLIRLLELIEDAESAKEAVWLPPRNRAEVAHIRELIEEQT